MELSYVTEKSEKETVKLFMRRRGSLKDSLLMEFREMAAAMAVLWPVGVIYYCIVFRDCPFSYCVAMAIALLGSAVFCLCFSVIERIIAQVPRRAYRQRETHKVEYRLTDDEFAFTVGGASFSSPWKVLVKKFWIDKKVIYLYGKNLPFEAQCIPDWQGHGVSRKELVATLKKAGLKKAMSRCQKFFIEVAATLVSFAALLTIYFYIGGIEWGDWTIPDEDSLRLELRDVPDEDNAYLALEALTNVYNVAEGDWDSKEISDKMFVRYFSDPFFIDGDSDEMSAWAAVREAPSSPKLAAMILADNTEFFEKFRSALALKGYAEIDKRLEDAKRKKEGKNPWVACLPLYKPFIEFAQLVALRVQVALERGDVEAAVSHIGEIHALGQLLKVNNEELVGCLVGALIEKISFRKMCDVVAMGKDTVEVVERFNKMVAVSEANALTSWERALKTEIAMHFEEVEWICDHSDHDLIKGMLFHILAKDWDSYKDWDNSSPKFLCRKFLCRILLGWPGFSRFAFHRREMLYRQAMLGRAMLAGDDDLTEMILHEIPRNPFLPNFAGNILAVALCPFLSSYPKGHRLDHIRPLLVLAAEKWRMAHGGKNPPTLDALVPDYLAAVPADPWDKAGGPIKYDASLGVAWSVGKEGKYDYRKVAKEYTSGSESSVDKDTQACAFRLDAKPIFMPEFKGRKAKTPTPFKEESHEKAETFDEVEINDHTWRFATNGVNATITGVSRAVGSIEIPPEITVGSNTYAVTGIGHSAFSNCRNLRSVTIPDGVTEIGAMAFRDCARLASVTIPCSMTSIGDMSFDGCTGLKSFVVRIPSNVTNVGAVVVLCNDFITGFSVAEDNPAYRSVSGLLLSKDGRTLVHGVNGDVTVPEGVTRINRFAFSDCGRLTHVAIPRSVTHIGEHVFDRCSRVKSFVVDKNNPNYKSINGMLLTKDGRTLIHGVNGDAVVPDGVTCIGDGSFAGCTGLTRVTIPDSVTNIACNAFYGCTGLESFVVDKNNPNYKSINGMLLTKDCKFLVAMTVKKPMASKQKDCRGKWLVWIVILLAVVCGTYLARRIRKRRRRGGESVEQGKVRRLELTYTAEKSEKETINLFLQRRWFMDVLRSGCAILAVLWLLASAFWLTSEAHGLCSMPFDNVTGITIAVAGTFVLYLTFFIFNVILVTVPRRAYRRRGTPKVEYRLTDDALAFTVGGNQCSLTWNKVAKKFRLDHNAIFLFGDKLPFEARCIPDWHGRGVEWQEMFSMLRRVGLEPALALGKFVVLGKFFRRMAVVCILLWIISAAVRSDTGQALRWRISSAMGNAEAQCRLGACYEQGKGVRRDMNEAERWYREAVEQGYREAAVRRVDAQLSYGYNSSYEGVLKHWRKAAEQGYREAQYRLGESYHEARGVEKNPVEAVRWYRYAAEQGHERAQYALGCCYEKGEGVERDRVEAFRWYHKAASTGCVEAREKLEAAKEAGTLDARKVKREERGK